MIPLPNPSQKPITPFRQAIEAVEHWLDGKGAAFVKRSNRLEARRKAASWEFELDHPTLGAHIVQLAITHDFPANTPQVYFPASLCLKLPHIEEDGKFCHGVDPSPNDYDDPCKVIDEVLKKLSQFWVNSINPAWVNAEFQRECLAYWSRFCYLFYRKNGMPTPRSVCAVLMPITQVTEGRLASYRAKEPGRAASRSDKELRSTRVLTTMGSADPHAVALQHGWSTGTLVRGDALWVPLAPCSSWTPKDWPQSLDELESLVRMASGDKHSVKEWLTEKTEQEAKEKTAGRYRSKLIVLVQGGTCYGYLITPSLIPYLTAPSIVPVEIERVDADWALARDYDLTLLRGRRNKRVLMIGCGSLGAPIAELLAKSGVSELHLADKEFFSIENCARHVLGAEHIGMAKASVLADRIRRQIPGVKTKPLRVLAADWVSQVCSPGSYDLIIDCTGESSVRTVLSRFRERAFGDVGIVHVWLEPFGAAAHTIYANSDLPWPYDDPWERVNAAHWPQDVRVKLPACSSGFNPYGAADAWQAAGFAAERILACLNLEVPESMVWSWVRSSAYFDKLNVETGRTELIPEKGSIFDSCYVTRSLQTVLADE